MAINAVPLTLQLLLLLLAQPDTAAEKVGGDAGSDRAARRLLTLYCAVAKLGEGPLHSALHVPHHFKCDLCVEFLLRCMLPFLPGRRSRVGRRARLPGSIDGGPPGGSRSAAAGGAGAGSTAAGGR